ncbi:MAG: cysteine--tRNA ligase [Dehalococcoidia bacterium]|nr:cysteine--tRNA ligase [Chloroflexota bacterium]OUW95453.1 MAG: cysteine--tRNA ligase [Chloroflexi bacterium TMED230]RZP13640.1 MAG: cysteine--tRNA ligase [Chloroflexota bacterium]|tara:strand:+ start:18409 stop:19743 length:1335 start_codon:yes stop_codon:yes gene_type:complete
MHLYNTLTKQKEKLDKKEIKMYVCGVTVYDRPHLGHALSTITFDVLHRFLEYIGYSVIRVQNFTDVDDKIIAKSKELRISPKEVAEKYIKAFFEDMDNLGVRRADIHPRATEDMNEIIELIKDLIDKKAAYELNGSVYFDVNFSNDYGKLSKRNLEDLIEGNRIENEPDKKNHGDFALWKHAEEDETYWDSPWGKGRPGWHIECSAMVKKHLGNSIDIHGGGLDLVFPHHENEIAQSESSTGHKPFAQIWVHNGLLKRSGDEKMSKSLGNSLDVRDALNNYSGNSIRLWILQSHYRHPSSLDENSLDIAQKSIQRIQRTLILRGEDGFDNKDYKNKFLIAMKDDLGTPKAIATIFDLIHDINKSNDLDKKINEGVILLEELLGILGFNFEDKNQNDSEITNLIKLRNQLRLEKEYDKADQIREDLLSKGIEILDSKDGTTFRKI